MSTAAADRPSPVRSASANEKIDVIIPAVEKDLATLPHVIDSIRRFVSPPVGDIYIVAPDSPKIRSLAHAKRCTFVHENDALELKKSQIVYRSKTWERSGWLYQQLLKLSGDRIARRARFLTVDADTVFIRPHRFRSGERTIFYCRGWSQPEYFRTYRKLLGAKAPSPSSFVTHYMLFDRRRLASLKAAIERRHGVKWYRAILQSIDKTKPFGFSEFETYANFVYTADPAGVVMRPARNKHIYRPFASLSEAEKKKLAARYRSLSFHQRQVYSRRGTSRNSGTNGTNGNSGSRGGSPRRSAARK